MLGFFPHYIYNSTIPNIRLHMLRPNPDMQIVLFTFQYTSALFSSWAFSHPHNPYTYYNITYFQIQITNVNDKQQVTYLWNFIILKLIFHS